MLKKLLFAASMMALANSANAIVMVAGTSFDDNAFADSLLGSSGSFVTAGGLSVEDSVTGSNLSSWAGSYSSSAYLDLGFSDNYLVNGAGADLALYELGVPAIFEVQIQIGGTTISYTTANTGYSATDLNGVNYAVTATYIDLDDFGFSSGAMLNNLRVGWDTTLTPGSLAVVGAINSASVSVPEPATLGLLSLGLLAGFTGSRRSSRRPRKSSQLLTA